MVGSKSTPRVLLVGADEAGGTLLATWLERGGCEVLVSDSLHGIVEANTLVDLAILACAKVSENILAECKIFKKSLGSLAPDLMMLNDTKSAPEIANIYDSGVDLLVPLPASELELVKPALLLVARAHEKQKMRYQNERAKVSAFDSMRESERSRQLIHVVSDFIGVQSYEELTAALFRFTQQWGYACSVVVHDEGQHFYYADDGAVHPFEQELAVTFWESVHNEKTREEHIVQNEERGIVSFSKITVLVRRAHNGQMHLLLDALVCLAESLEKAIQSVGQLQETLSEKRPRMRALDFLQEDIFDSMGRRSFGTE